MKVRKGDMVIVLSGKDKGKTGQVSAAMPRLGKVLVDGVNVAKRHKKPTKANETGGIVDQEMPIDVSNVAVMGTDGKPTRVGYKVDGDKKTRVSKRTGGAL
jgi:large subunit ribosomal protein L24